MAITGATTSAELRRHNRVRLLRAVHDGGAGRTRSELTRALELTRGTASVLVAELVEDGLLHEEPASAHSRGRPTGVPGPHPSGPVALAVDLREDAWEVAACELGGQVRVLDSWPHDGTPSGALVPLGRALRGHLAGLGGRAIGIGIAVAGPIRDGRFADISHLGWRAIDVPALLALSVTAQPTPQLSRPSEHPLSGTAQPASGPSHGAEHPPSGTAQPAPRPPGTAPSRQESGTGEDTPWLYGAGGGVVVLVGNDTAFAALAEGRRGELRGVGVGLHVHVDFDLGGVLVVDGHPLAGAGGVGAEFGHMPLLGLQERCLCGARGCWGMRVGSNALLRHLGMPAGGGKGRDQAEAILLRSRMGENGPHEAVTAGASALGTGLAALVNAHDPEAVTLSGLGVDLLDQARAPLNAALLDGLMDIRRDRPPRITPSALGWRGPLLGAMESVFDAFLTPEGLRAWTTRRTR